MMNEVEPATVASSTGIITQRSRAGMCRLAPFLMALFQWGVRLRLKYIVKAIKIEIVLGR